MDRPVAVFTGERALPLADNMDPVTMTEHLCRYEFVMQFARGEVLDAACGAGYGSAMLARSASTVTGIDVDESAIDYARQTYSAPNIQFLVADVTQVPLANCSFDLIVSYETIEHVRNGADALRELQRMLKPSGTLAISVPLGGDSGNPYHLSYYQRLGFRHFVGGFFREVTVLYQRGNTLSKVARSPLLARRFPNEYIVALCSQPYYDQQPPFRVFMHTCYVLATYWFEAVTTTLARCLRYVRASIRRYRHPAKS